MTSDTYVTRALFDTLVEHVTLFAGSPDNVGLIRNMLGALPLPTYRLDVLARHLAHLQPCPFAGCVTSNEIKVALGEAGSIWPSSIKGAVALAHYEDLALKD